MKRRVAWALLCLFLFSGIAGVLAQSSNPTNAVLTQFYEDVRSRGFEYATEQLAYMVGQGAVNLIFPNGIVIPAQVYDATACTSNGCPGTGTACVWDGAQDVAPCIQAAAATAIAAGNAQVDLPAGVLLIGSQLCVAPSGCATAGGGFLLKGRGPATVLKVMTTNVSNPYIFNFANVSNITVSDLTIDCGGESGAQTNAPVQLYNTNYIKLDNVTLQNCAGMGVNGSLNNNTTVTRSSFLHIGNRWKVTHSANDRFVALSFCCGGFNNTVTDSYFEAIGLDAINTGSQTKLVVANNTFNLLPNAILERATISPQPSDFSSAIFPLQAVGASITGNTIDGAPGSCIDAPGLHDSTIAGNVLKNCGGAGIGLFTGYDQAVFTGHTSGTTLTIDTMTSGTIAVGQALTHQTGAATAVAPGTYITAPIDSTHWAINKSQTVASEAMYSATNTRAVTVSGNTIVDNDQWSESPWTGAITVGNGVADTATIDANTMKDDQLTPTMAYGIAFQSGGLLPAPLSPINITIGPSNTIVGPLTAQFLAPPTFSVAGNSASGPLGSATAGTFTAGATGTNIVVITPGSGMIPAAANGWNCRGVDQTSGVALEQTASSTTTCTISGTSTSGHTIRLTAAAY